MVENRSSIVVSVAPCRISRLRRICHVECAHTEHTYVHVSRIGKLGELSLAAARCLPAGYPAPSWPPNSTLRVPNGSRNRLPSDRPCQRIRQGVLSRREQPLQQHREQPCNKKGSHRPVPRVENGFKNRRPHSRCFRNESPHQHQRARPWRTIQCTVSRCEQVVLLYSQLTRPC